MGPDQWSEHSHPGKMETTLLQNKQHSVLFVFKQISSCSNYFSRLGPLYIGHLQYCGARNKATFDLAHVTCGSKAGGLQMLSDDHASTSLEHCK